MWQATLQSDKTTLASVFHPDNGHQSFKEAISTCIDGVPLGLSWKMVWAFKDQSPRSTKSRLSTCLLMRIDKWLNPC